MFALSFDGFTSPKSPAPPSPLGIPSSSNSFTSPIVLYLPRWSLLEERASISFHETYASFVVILLRTLLHSTKPQLFSFHMLPHSLRKTPGWGIPRFSAVAVRGACSCLVGASNPTASARPDPCSARHHPVAPISFRIRVYEKTGLGRGRNGRCSWILTGVRLAHTRNAATSLNSCGCGQFAVHRGIWWHSRPTPRFLLRRE